MRLPKYAVPISFIGTVTCSTILLRDYMAGGRYKGEERIAGKTVVITGANTGIGKETARDLAKRGGRIIMACRDLEKCEVARTEIMLETANLNVECKKLDLASYGSIRAFCKTIQANERHLDILINNAGVMSWKRTLTEDGIEANLGVNHMGHFLLTHLLLDLLKKSAPSRIIIVSSVSHTRIDGIHFDDLNSAQHYSESDAHAQSKLANLLHQKELVKRLEGTGVTVNSVHPGAVATDIQRSVPYINSFTGKFFNGFIKFLFMKTPSQGAQTTIRLAVDPSLENVTGKYFCDCEEREPSPEALDDEAAKRLWAISQAWTRANVV